MNSEQATVKVRTQEVLSMLKNVKHNGNGQYSASCPCPSHGNGKGDKHQSLSIKEGEQGRTLLDCKAGCDTKEVLAAIGLTFSDISPSQDPQAVQHFDRNHIEAVYDYGNGTRKCRDIYKNFIWEHSENGQWILGRGNAPHVLYRQGDEQQTVYVVEGEKDVNNLSTLGLYVVSSEHGAGKGQGKWYPSYTEELAGKDIRIIPDNDVVGIQFMRDSVAPALIPVAKSLKIYNLSDICPELPENGDISDIISTYGKDKTIQFIEELEHSTGEYEPIQSIFDVSILPALLASYHPHTNARYKWYDLGNGNLFSDVFQNCLVYVPEKKSWYFYTGKQYRQDTGSVQARELCKRLADGLNAYALNIQDERQRTEYLRFCANWQRRQYRETILSDASTVRTTYFSAFDKDPWLFNCQNGTLNLKTLVFRQHRPSDMLTKLSGVYYNPDARCERWESFIDEIMCSDKEKARFLQKALGYSLTGCTDEECFFILYGATSRNGKGTLMETYRTLMGDYGRATNPETITRKTVVNGSAPNEDVARLAGARFINISEPDKGMVLSSALVKSLTGNDTVTAACKYENSVEFKMVGKLFVNTNHLPQITDPSVFTSDRVKVIPFLRHFEANERDTSLKRLFTERNNLSAVLNWCIEGLQLYLMEGLKIPDSIREATDKYQYDSDKVSRFIDEKLESANGIRTRTSEVYEAYKAFCEDNHFKISSPRTFNADLESHGIEVTRKRPTNGDSLTTVIVGYALKNNEFQQVDISTPFD